MLVSESCNVLFAAGRTGVSQERIRKAIAAGEIPSERDLGGILHIRLADVKEWAQRTDARSALRKKGPKREGVRVTHQSDPN